MRQKFYCSDCKEVLKFKDMNGSLIMYCPKCRNARIVDYPNDWETVKHEYISDRK